MISLTIPTDSSSTDAVTSESIHPDRSRTRLLRIARAGGWILLSLTLIIFFTVLKLPEERLKSYVQGSLNSILSPRGISISANQNSISVAFGLTYTMKDVTLNLPSPQPPAKVDKIAFSPSLLSIVLGQKRGKIWISQGEGILKASFSFKETEKNMDFSASFSARDMDLGRVGILPVALGIQGSLIATGEGSFSGQFNTPPTISGRLQLVMNKIALDQQSILGFSIPKISISEGKIDLIAENGKINVKTLSLGKPGNAADDLRVQVSGEAVLGKQWDSSTLNLKTNLGLSQNVLKSFVLIDSLLGNMKQEDGTYAFTLTGPAYSPTPVPIPGKQ